MKTTHGLSIAALSIALLATPALASDKTNLLNNVVDGVQGTVNSTVDSVDNTLSNAGNVSGTTGDTTGNAGDVTGSIGDIGKTGDVGKAGDIGSFSEFLNDLNAGNLDNVGNASDIGKVSDLHVVNVEDAFKDFDTNAFNDALSNNSTDIAALQDNLSGNQALKNLLNNNNVDVSHIVGINNSQNGALTIYTDGSDD
jgi:hypothetical protein